MGSSQQFVELPYTLHGRYTAITIAWTVIIFPPCILNLTLFYALWYGTNLSRTVALSIPTAIFGAATIFTVTIRLRKLLASTPTYRPLNSPRAALDPFQWGYFIGIIIVTAEIVIGLAVPSAPLVHLLSMPAPSLLFEMGLLAAFILVLQIAEVRAPFRIGSFPAGAVARPMAYYIVEDVVAVDGGAGMDYRLKLDERYTSSPMFRRMMWNLDVAWMVFSFVVGAAMTAIVFTVKEEIAYGLAWGVPFVLAAVMAAATILYVKRCLRAERREWTGSYQGNLRIVEA